MFQTYEQLRDHVLKGMPKTVDLLFSGGVDSTLLLHILLEAGHSVNIITFSGKGLPNPAQEELARSRIFTHIAGNKEKYVGRVTERDTLDCPPWKAGAICVQQQAVYFLRVAPLYMVSQTLVTGLIAGDQGVSYLKMLHNLVKADNPVRLKPIALLTPLINVLPAFVLWPQTLDILMFTRSCEMDKEDPCGICTSCLSERGNSRGKHLNRNFHLDFAVKR